MDRAEHAHPAARSDVAAEPQRLHLDFVDHHGDDEDLSPEALAALSDAIWKVDNVEFTTVGVDVGSSTSHLMFARVHLQRLGDMLSSRFVVVEREILWRSPILLTPYRPDNTIDAERLDAFIQEAYRAAGLTRADVDTGAVILTGEALKRTNARAIADLFAADSGKFVCATAGHHLEALLAAHGSGAVALSRQRRQTLLNVDIGGGTSKLALIRDGTVLQTAAIAVGGRLVARDAHGALERIEGPAYQAAAAAGVPLALGQPLAPADEARLVQALAEALIAMIRQETPTGLVRELLLTEPLPGTVQPEAITFSGGVAEYIYGREEADYRDLAPALAAAVRAALADGRLPFPVLDPGEGIRATVIGASQFTVQVSGNTISISDEAALPIRNLPVLFPRLDLGEEITPAGVAAAIREAVTRFDLTDGETPLALAFRWRGDPLYARLRALAEGICQGLPQAVQRGLPLVLLFDHDVGKTLGEILKQELGVPGAVVSIDGMQLRELDYVDIGEVIQPTDVVPVVIKSLLFSHAARH
jgi:ethanolamine utilization protein EutA